MVILFPHINESLKKEDIEGLLALGAPQDEYSHVARLIADVLSYTAGCTEDNIAAVFSKIWAEHFDLSEHDMELRLPAVKNIAHYLMTQQ